MMERRRIVSAKMANEQLVVIRYVYVLFKEKKVD